MKKKIKIMSMVEGMWTQLQVGELQVGVIFSEFDIIIIISVCFLSDCDLFII